MRYVYSLCLILLVGCFAKKEVTQTVNSSASINPNAPSLWQSSMFPLSLRQSTALSASRRTDGNAMADAWEDALSDQINFFTTTSTTTEVSTTYLNNLDNYWDSIMGIYAVSSWPSSLPTSALAVTQIFGVRTNKGTASEFVKYIHADILVNFQYFTFVDRVTSMAAGYDYRTVILHEMGHFLGLYHDTLNTSVMAPSIGQSDVNRVPQSADIAELQTRYTSGIYALSADQMYLASSDPALPVFELATDSNEGVVKITMELHAHGECVHKVDGIKKFSHQLDLEP